MRWEIFYQKVFDWPISTSVELLEELVDIGTEDEIAEVIRLLGNEEQRATTLLLNRALASEIKFSGASLASIYDICDEERFRCVLYDSAPFFTYEDMEALYVAVEDEIIYDIANLYDLPLPEELEEEEW